MQPQPQTIRTPADQGWRAIQTQFALDTRLSFDERGVMAYLLCIGPDVEIRIDDLLDQTASADKKTGRDRLYAILRRLKNLGYVERQRRHDTEGRIVWEAYQINAAPFPENPEMARREPLTENPYMVNPEMAESSATIGVLNNTSNLIKERGGINNNSITRAHEAAPPLSETYTTGSQQTWSDAPLTEQEKTTILQSVGVQSHYAAFGAEALTAAQLRMLASMTNEPAIAATVADYRRHPNWRRNNITVYLSRYERHAKALEQHDVTASMVDGLRAAYKAAEQAYALSGAEDDYRAFRKAQRKLNDALAQEKAASQMAYAQ